MLDVQSRYDHCYLIYIYIKQVCVCVKVWISRIYKILHRENEIQYFINARTRRIAQKPQT